MGPETKPSAQPNVTPEERDAKRQAAMAARDARETAGGAPAAGATPPRAKSKKPEKKQIVSANLLLEGDVVYRTAAGDWSLDLQDATVAETKEAAAALLADIEADAHLVVDAALAAVSVDSDGQITPISMRERIRAAGPTMRLDLGKQAQRPQRATGATGAADAEAA
ncbi:MAG: DUF2849 domain-containing protein [Pseudomonadota bacterium]